MGLKQNTLYKATRHFKQRLYERFGVVDSQCMPFMRQMYGTMHKDVETTQKHHEYLRKTLPKGKQADIENAEIWFSEEYHCYVVVDTKNYKLITIYTDPDYGIAEIVKETDEMKLEDQVTIELTPPVETEPETENKVDESTETELDRFAKELADERKALDRKTRYRYAQRVVQLNQEVFENFIKSYQKVVKGNATQANMEALNQLYEMKDQLINIFPEMKNYKR